MARGTGTGEKPHGSRVEGWDSGGDMLWVGGQELSRGQASLVSEGGTGP